MRRSVNWKLTGWAKREREKANRATEINLEETMVNKIERSRFGWGEEEKKRERKEGFLKTAPHHFLWTLVQNATSFNVFAHSTIHLKIFRWHLPIQQSERKARRWPLSLFLSHYPSTPALSAVRFVPIFRYFVEQPTPPTNVSCVKNAESSQNQTV